MPPQLYSRYQFCTAQADDEGRLFLSERVPYRFRAFADNRTHIVQEGDTLQVLAATYFEGMPNPAWLWWVIADFQPDPILDPTIALAGGQTIIIPSVQTLIERVFSESRRAEAEAESAA